MILSRLQQTRYPGLMIIMLAVALSWLLSRSGPVPYLDGIVYDQMVRHNISQSSEAPQVVLVQIPLRHSQSGDEYWEPLLRNLLHYQPASISISFLPEQASRNFYRLAQNHQVLFGRSLDSHQKLQPLPPAARNIDLDWALHLSPAMPFGIARTQWLRYSVQQQDELSLSARIARLDHHPDEPDFRVNFMAGAHFLPMIHGHRIQENNIIPSLLQDRHILVGLAGHGYLQTLMTPVSSATHPMTLLEFQGYATQTLLTDHAITQAHPLIILVLAVILSALSLIIFQQTSIAAATRISVFMVILLLLSSWLLLSWQHYYLPVSMLILSQLLTLAIFFRHKNIAEENTIQQIVHHNTLQLQEKMLPASFLDSQQHWAQIANLINQMLDLNRTLFLERIPGDHRVKEIYALGCTIDHIQERRRDYQRYPYTAAIEHGEALKLDKPYLQPALDSETQYLVPLLFSGEVLGFWAFSIEPEKAALMTTLQHRLRDFGEQISELLYQRQQRHRQDERHPMRRYLQLQPQTDLLQKLKNVNLLSNRRLRSTEQVINGLDTATALYNLFGDIIQINQRMTTLLQQFELPLYQLTIVDLLSRMTALDPAQARQVMRHLILEHSSMNIPVTLQDDQDQALILHIKPLLYQAEAHQDIVGAPVFQLAGILLEIIDITHYRKLYKLQETLVDHLNIELRNDLQSLKISQQLLSRQHLPPELLRKTVDTVNHKLDETCQKLLQAQQHLRARLTETPLEYYPIDPLPLIRQALDQQQEVIRKKQLQVKQSGSMISDLVMADPPTLGSIFNAIIHLLVHDAVEQSTLTIDVQHIEQQVHVKLQNTGFGLPEATLKHYIFEQTDTDNPDFITLYSAQERLNNWDSSLNVHSDVGEGMRFELTLRAFL